jgi:hypothetical protein
MRILVHRCPAILLTFALFLAPAALSATPSQQAERDSNGLFAFVRSVLAVLWSENDSILDPGDLNGATLTGDHGSGLDPDGYHITGDHGSGLDPSGNS